MSEADIRDRVTRLEANQVHMSEKIDDMSHKVDGMYEVLLGARGFKVFLISGAVAFGFVLGVFKDALGLWK